MAQSKFNLNGDSKAIIARNYTEQVDKLITDSCKAVKGKIVHQKHTFELLGYDFIIDEQLNTILIEVNTNPSLDESNNLLRKLIPRMIDDTLNVVLDPIFTKNENQHEIFAKYRSKFTLPGEVFNLK